MKNNKKFVRVVSVAIALFLALSAITGIFPVSSAEEPTEELEESATEPFLENNDLSAKEKIDSGLLDLEGDEEVKVFIATTNINELGDKLRTLGIDTHIGSVETEERFVVPTVTVPVRHLERIATLSSTLSIIEYRTPVVPESELDYEVSRMDELQGHGNAIQPSNGPGLTGYHMVNHHGADEAHTMGYTGDGVNIAIVDTGVDFANADLMDKWAVYDNETSPYHGWPIAYDDGSMQRYIFREEYGWNSDEVGAHGYDGSWYADTSNIVTAVDGEVFFDGEYYKVSGIPSASGEYKIGYHVDAYMEDMYGEQVTVLVTDTEEAGVYDTVYVDLDNNKDFTNEKPVNQSSPIAYRDDYDSGAGEYGENWDDGDGYPDISGGLVYFIADGENPLPFSEHYTNNIMGVPNRIPESGELIAFMGEYSGVYTHGTQCAGSSVAEGDIGYGFAEGMAPDAKIIPTLAFQGNFFNSWEFTMTGYDGNPNNDDGYAKLVSNSWGYTSLPDTGWHEDLDRLTDLYLRAINSGETTFLISAGNYAPGYGTTTAPAPAYAMSIAAGTEHGYRVELEYETGSNAGEGYKEVVGFSSRGPTAHGKSSIDIVATGGFDWTPTSLNTVGMFGMGDGYWQMDLFSGTSMAGPTVAGGMALVYQAYYESHGEYPDPVTARKIIDNSADDMKYDIFSQGAGWLNCARAVEIASGEGGITVAPTGTGETVETDFGHIQNNVTIGLEGGDYDGVRRDMFPNMMFPGDTDTQEVAVDNHNATESVNVSVSSAKLEQVRNESLEYTTGEGDTDIIWDITEYVEHGADLVTVNTYYDIDEFQDPFGYGYTYDVYWTELHDWVDDNEDGEINLDELARYNYGYVDGNVQFVAMHDPHERTNDGVVLRARYSNQFGMDPEPGMNITHRIASYNYTEAEWLTFSDNEIEVPAGGSGTFDVTFDIPSDMAPGMYDAAVMVDDGVHTTVLPTSVNVGVRIENFDDVVTIGGAENETGLYDNSHMFGHYDWYYGTGDTGDWRYFFVDIDESLPTDDVYLTSDLTWENERSDINQYLLGEDGVDMLSNNAPNIYGPYGLSMLESTDVQLEYGGKWEWSTSTGGPRDVIYTQLKHGLMEVMLHNTRLAGDNVSEPFTLELSLARYEPTEYSTSHVVETAEDRSGNFTVDFSFGKGTDSLDTWTKGPFLRDEYLDESITHMSSWYTEYEVEDWDTLKVFTEPTDTSDPELDIDLYVHYYDWDHNYVGSMASETPDSSESIEWENPEDGYYEIEVYGWYVPPGGDNFNLWVDFTPSGVEELSTLGFDDLPEDIASGDSYSFNVTYDLPHVASTYSAVAYFGHEGTGAPYAVEFQIELIDDAPMSLTPVSPVPDSEISVTEPGLKINATIEDELISQIEDGYISVDGTNLDEENIYLDLANKEVGGHVDFALASGVHTVEIWLEDSTGDEATTTWDFTVLDEDEPTITPITPMPGQLINDPLPYYQFEITEEGAESGMSVENMSVYFEGAFIDRAHYNWDGSLLTVQTDEFMMPDGELQLRVNVSDDAGNSAEIEYTFFLDATPPEIINISPADGESIQGDSIVFSAEMGNPYDFSGLDEALFYFDDMFSIEAQLEDNIATAKMPFMISEGEYSLSVRMWDEAGNMAEEEITFEVDNTEPLLQITSPEGEVEEMTFEDEFTIEGMTEPDATLWIDGETVPVDGDTGGFTYTTTLEKGFNSFHIIAEDDAGNRAETIVSALYMPDIPELYDEIDALNDEIDRLDVEIADIHDLITGLQEDIAGLEDDISALESDINSLQDQLDGLQDELDSLRDELDTKLDELETAIEENSDDVDDIMDEIDDIRDEISDIESDISDIQSDLGNVESDVTIIQNEQTEMDEDLSGGIATARNLGIAGLIIAIIALIIALVAVSNKGKEPQEPQATEEPVEEEY